MSNVQVRTGYSVRHALPRLCALLAVVALAVLGPGLPARAVEPSFIQTQVKVEGSTLTATTVLYTQQSQPIPNRQVSIKLSTGQESQATTGGDGYVTTAVPVTPPADGKVEVRVSFAGDAQFAAVESVTPVTVEVKTVTTTKLSAKANTSKAQPGDVITITGTLTLTDGTAVQSAQIQVQSGDKAVSPPGTTGTNGDFNVLAQVPSDAAPGNLALTVSFAAAGGLEPSSSVVQLNVQPLPSETPSPSAAPTTTAASSAPPTVATSPATLTDGSDSATPSASASAPAGPSSSSTIGKQMLIGGLILAVVFAGLITAAWTAHTRSQVPRRGADRAQFIDDEGDDLLGERTDRD